MLYVDATINESMLLGPVYYSYTLNDNETLVVDISSSELPGDFPLPCAYGKCARDNVCPCRLKSVGCWQYCKCAKSEFKNPKMAEIYV